MRQLLCVLVFFFNDTATTEIYPLSLHDALPIWRSGRQYALPVQYAGAGDRLVVRPQRWQHATWWRNFRTPQPVTVRLRSEEHTSELQSRQYLVCRLLLEKKKNKPNIFKL